MDVRISVGAAYDGDPSPDDLRILTGGVDRATAVMGWSDSVAHCACNSLDTVGISIPEEVAVVGFDGFLPRYPLKFHLTTIRAPWSSLGREAVRRLSDYIVTGAVEPLTTLPVSFHQGRTT